jgi:hypothetical protein
VSICYRTKRIREGEGGGRLGWPLGRVGKERKKKEEERKKKWQIRPKFVRILKRSKFESSGGDDWLRSDL